QCAPQTPTGRSQMVVGAGGGRDRYGSCLARLPPATLGDGSLPILETRYVDAGGTVYRQESFAVRGLGTGDLVTYVRLTADARSGKGGVLRLVPKGSRRGARVEQGTMRVTVAPGETATLYAGWLVPFGGAPVPIDQA